MQANPELLKAVTKFIDNDQMKASLSKAVGNLNIRIDVGRLCNLFLSYCMRQPRLLECSKQTLFDALMFITQCGLEPILGQVYLVPFRNNKSGETDCQVILGYKGLVVLAIRSGMVSHIESRIVYECDCRAPGVFDLELGDAPRLTHKPNWRDRVPNSEMVGAYCIVTLSNGQKITDFMNRAEVENGITKAQDLRSLRWRRRETSVTSRPCLACPTTGCQHKRKGRIAMSKAEFWSLVKEYGWFILLGLMVAAICVVALFYGTRK